MLAPVQSFASEPPFAEIDALYFNRHKDANLERSITELEERVRENPKDGDALWRLARSLVRRGESNKMKKEKLADFTRAEELARQAVSISSGIADAHFMHGVALGRRGQTRGVMRSLFMVGDFKRRMRETLRINPNHAGAHLALGEMLRQLPGFAGGSKTEALKELEAARGSDPNFTATYTSLAEVYLDLGKDEKAREALDQVSKIQAPTEPAEYDKDLAEAKRLQKSLNR